MSFLEPLQKEMVNREMSSSASLSFTIFIGAAISGFYFYDMFQRWKKAEERMWQIEQKIHDTSSNQDAQADTIQEHDQRIREKRDYDESDEIEEGKYQAWRGEYTKDSEKAEIMLWREKENTIRQNQTWLTWNGEKDGASVARDFYLGNTHPEFQWEIREGDYYYITVATDSFVEAWDSVIKLQIYLTFTSQQSLLDFVGVQYFNGNPTINLALKKLVEENSIQWKKCLIDVVAK